jgi:predicted nucleotidyltransferase
MKEIILGSLKEIETVERVKIIYACESGSRAWGFPSADSDYDVRFIYIHPVEWYLSIENKRDVIERPIIDALDFSGWEMRKALRLLRKSNPPLMEWLGSPIVYMENDQVVSELRRLKQSYCSYIASSYHYLHMAQGNYRKCLKGDQVRVKKYFYVLRPIMALMWIERGLGAVPTNFNDLLGGLSLNQDLLSQILSLLESKRAGTELDSGPRIPIFHDFIEEQLTHFEKKNFKDYTDSMPVEALNRLFRTALEDAWNL